jgi:hypothetical protein
MINIILAYDELAANIGANFEQCYLRLDAEIDLSNFQAKILNGEKCSREELEQAISALDGKGFIFVGYSHGNGVALTSSIAAGGYVNIDNSYMFGCSLFYTNGCYAGDELKQALEKADCYGFVGYEGEVLLPDDLEDEALFIDCENKGLVHFLTSGETLAASVQAMKEYYRLQCDALAEVDLFKATRLLKNMELLVYYDKCGITSSSMMNG